MSKIFEGPSEKTERLVPRRTTDKRGGMIEPERSHVQPRMSGHSARPLVTPSPEVPGSRRASGSPMENEMPSEFVQPVVTRATPRADTESNPAK